MESVEVARQLMPLPRGQDDKGKGKGKAGDGREEAHGSLRTVTLKDPPSGARVPAGKTKEKGKGQGKGGGKDPGNGPVRTTVILPCRPSCGAVCPQRLMVNHYVSDSV